MMKLIKLGAIVALLVTGQALGQSSKISYTLELQGNNRSTGSPNWENPTACIPPAFTLGNTDDGQTFTAGAIITWAARIAVTGTHASGEPSGAANVVASLELHQGSATGPLEPLMVHGSPTTGGWFSTINDGDGDGTRVSSCGFPADPLEDAAFPVAWSISNGMAGPQYARAFDLPADEGPYLDYYQYPSDSGHPAASTAAAGTLVGMGCGYSRYSGYGCPSACGFGTGLNTAGIGKTTATCGVTLGNGPIIEGQMNTSGLADGTYVLVLVPGTGNNIVKGGFSCDDSDPGAFAVIPDLANEGDTITFTIGTVCVPPGQATGPSPADSATGVSLTPTLTWTAGTGVVNSHDVYFGTAVSPPFIQNQAGTSYAPGTLLCNTLYYWKINEVGCATTTGVVWSFTTIPCSATITQWRSMKTHTGCGELPIVLDPLATGATSTKPTVETRGAGAATQGVLKVQVDFSGPVTLDAAANIIVTYRPTTQGASPSVGSPSGVIPTSVAMADADTLNLVFASGLLPNLGCVNISIGDAFVEAITGDIDCNIRSLAGDVGSNGTVALADQLAIKAEINAGSNVTTTPSKAKFDINLSCGLIALADQLAAKAQTTSPPKAALCP